MHPNAAGDDLQPSRRLRNTGHWRCSFQSVTRGGGTAVILGCLNGRVSQYSSDGCLVRAGCLATRNPVYDALLYPLLYVLLLYFYLASSPKDKQAPHPLFDHKLYRKVCFDPPYSSVFDVVLHISNTVPERSVVFFFLDLPGQTLLCLRVDLILTIVTHGLCLVGSAMLQRCHHQLSRCSNLATDHALRSEGSQYYLLCWLSTFKCDPCTKKAKASFGDDTLTKSTSAPILPEWPQKPPQVKKSFEELLKAPSADREAVTIKLLNSLISMVYDLSTQIKDLSSDNSVLKSQI
uniref:Uncharacterized protein n=1 Tax=Timema douglasi TaxID=61478 RepID=A0A7R8VI49_TIMDO|nr:unnamed protein product [Timema douglasi]